MSNTLFTSFTLGRLTLPNRMVMAPLTRGRAGLDDCVPSAIMVEYYRQRASAGLLITEATHISPQGRGWYGAPGIHTAAQVAGWLKVTDAVHQAGGRIFLQLWHMGRASHRDFHDGELPVSASALAIAGEITTPLGRKAYEAPRALELSEIAGVVQQYAGATKLAQVAGFDGVEIHGANGYLIDQFLRDGSNRREDAYGGSIANRSRFLLEVVDAVTRAWAPDRVGIRLSPLSTFQNMSDSNPVALYSHVAEELNRFGLAYVHTLEALPGHMVHVPGEPVTPHIRRIFRGPLITNGGYDAAKATQAIENGEADLIAFGVPFLANPDLVARYRKELPLNPPDFATFYTHDAKGYTDYPAFQAAAPGW